MKLSQMNEHINILLRSQIEKKYIDYQQLIEQQAVAFQCQLQQAHEQIQELKR